MQDKCKNGGELPLSLDAIWGEYHARLAAFLHTKVSNKADAEDLLQDIMLKSYRSLPSIRENSSIKAWLFQITNNTIIDFYRKKGRENPLVAEDLWFAEDEITVDQELSRCVAPFISALPEDKAVLLRAIELEGHSQKEYARQQGIAYSTLKSRVQKAREQLRLVFEECCHFSLDARGMVTDFEAKHDSCKNC
ncbi:RNA polymerase sigma factor SigZ [Flexibacterium corallicola]|uniref:RNA polymerase sigma factor SigZ n=1 Tax=Flexibacterium corallicola TaxID=3037259 RepID=UPI00286F789A|nr:RNA polymerase sigma factor SigZ [Pseudovibrio sp. M1P-2-3]